MKKDYVSYNPTTKEIVITGLPVRRLLNRIDETYVAQTGFKQVKGSNVRALFNEINYIFWDTAEIKFFSFFSLEMYEMFTHLAEEYKDDAYAEIADELYAKTWISNYEKAEKIRTNTAPLRNLEFEPKDFQLEFIKQYETLKYQHDFDGYILSFEQGLGKTFTAIAIAECLKKEAVYIVCPNSVKDVWANEIRSYYHKYSNTSLFRKEVFIVGHSNYNKDTTRFIIVNQESIPSMFKYLNRNKDSMIIIDECQNFRGYQTKRVKAMLELKKQLDCHDCLLMSGTPIKAMPNELVPALRMIDPHFTEKLAELYIKAFSSTSIEAVNIVKARFKRCIYRKLKVEAVSLPEKHEDTLLLKVPHPERFFISKAKNEILEVFHRKYMDALKTGLFTPNKQSPYYRTSPGSYKFLDAKIEFENVVRKYSRAKNSITEEYLRFIFQNSVDGNWDLVTAQNVQKKFFGFLEKHVTPFVRTPEEKKILTTKFDGILGWAIAAKAAASSAIGTVISKYKNECFIEIWKYNYPEIIKRIKDNTEKTVIFTALVPTAEYISAELTKLGIENILVTGSGAGRTEKLNKFKTDDNIKVLVATTQTLSLGVTLTEATQMFFFGTPYRSADYEQACDRIHRIGQTKDVYIHNVLLGTPEKNITGRIEEILNWSEEMFNALMTEEIEY